MKGRGGSSTFVRRFSSVSLPRPVVLIVLIYIRPFKLFCPSGLKSNPGSWGRNDCLGFDPGSRTEASFGCSQSGRLCCLQNKRRVSHCLPVVLFSDIFECSFCDSEVLMCRCAVEWTIQAKRRPRLPQPKAFLLILSLVCIRTRWWCCINLAYSRPKEKLLQRLTSLVWPTLLCGPVHYFTLKHDKLCRFRWRQKCQMWLSHSQYIIESQYEA